MSETQAKYTVTTTTSDAALLKAWIEWEPSSSNGGPFSRMAGFKIGFAEGRKRGLAEALAAIERLVASL